jgi:hypothetical protein
MSTKITFVAAAIAALTLGVGVAEANTKGPSSPPKTIRHAGGAASQATNTQHQSHYNHFDRYRNQWKCYWLPTVSNGSVSGLEEKCIRLKN